MKNNYPLVGACLFLCFIGLNKSLAQSGPEFLDCSSTPVSLCVSDEGVRLPANNKIYLGEEDPDASSCSVHLTQKTLVRSSCGRDLQYEVQLFIDGDTSNAFILQPLTTITTDSAFEVELSFDTELSLDSIIRLNGIPYTSGCASFHRIRWIVSDSCGLTTVCDRIIDLYDCSKPFLTNPESLHVISSNIGGTAILQLDSLINDPNDDCALNHEILYSLYPDHHKSDSMFFICNVQAFGVELPFDIWIADEGIDLNCDGIISWNERNIQKQEILIVYNDNFGWCEPEHYYVFGEVETEQQQAIEKTEVTLSSIAHTETKITTADGRYSFMPFFIGASTISAYRNDAHKNGVSTLDLVRIQKHLLGKEFMKSPYQVIAADANNTQSLSVFDLVELRRLILGVQTVLPTTSWRFVPKQFVFQDSLNPWPFPETVAFTVGNEVNIDFIGIKIGDVNYTVQPNANNLQNRESLPELKWYVNQKVYLENEIIDILFFVDDASAIQGFQFTISSPDLEFLDATSETINLSGEHFGLFDDKITMSWFNEEGIRFSENDIVFTLKARSKSKGNLQKNLSINSDITEAEMYSMKDEVFIPKLLVINEGEPIVTSLPEPNPWKDESRISFHLKESGNVVFEVFDLNGQPVFTKNGNYNSGQNEIIIHNSDFPNRGILFYSIKTNEFISSNKMMVIP